MIRHVRYALIIGGVAFIVALIYVRFPFMPATSVTVTRDGDTSASSTVQIAGRTVSVEVADTPEARERGLSGKGSLSDDEGMLFMFEEDGHHSFWMKDMRFAIDIIWISSTGVIVHVEEGVGPETYPRVFVPRSEARYVIELPAGWVEAHDVRVGDIVQR